MTTPRARHDRESEEEAAILDALIARGEEGMTVLELRAFVDADIDAIEASLTELKQEGLIEVTEQDGSHVITPHESVMPTSTADTPAESVSERLADLWEAVRDRLPF